MKKIVLILVTVFLNAFLISCSSDDVLETLDAQNTETFATGGEDEQTPEEEEDEIDEGN